LIDDEFKPCMAMLFSYYNKQFDPVLLNVYWDRFKTYSYIDFYNAVNRHIDHEGYKFFPKVHELKTFLPEQKLIERQPSCTGCENTELLRKKYPPKKG
jgi:hypothetical protein